jgi:hypothetical protein
MAHSVFDLGELHWRNVPNLLPPDFDKKAAEARLNLWISGDERQLGKVDEEKDQARKEKERPDNYWVMTEAKTSGSGVQPRLQKNKAYAWINSSINSVSTEEHKLMNQNGFILDAIVNANGRCFWYVLSIAISKNLGQSVQPTDVKRNTLKKLQEMLKNNNVNFQQSAQAFMLFEDSKDNSNRFVKWFLNEIYNVPRGIDESENLYYLRVKRCILQLENELNLDRF